MNTEMLNALKEKAHKTAVEHGFYEEVKPDAFYLGLVMSEAGEAINADRKGMHADTNWFEEGMANGYLTPRVLFESYIKNSVEDEIADIVIRLLDFAGLKGCKLLVTDASLTPFVLIIEQRAKNGLSGTFFHLNGVLSDALDDCSIDDGVNIVISIISDCFQHLTGSDKDLWWFVEQKMRYNDLRPRLNGKKY